MIIAHIIIKTITIKLFKLLYDKHEYLIYTLNAPVIWIMIYICLACWVKRKLGEIAFHQNY